MEIHQRLSKLRRDADQLLLCKIKKMTRTVGFAALTDADGSQSFAFTDALPADAIIVGTCLNVTQAFGDGGVGVFTADLGISAGDLDSLIDGASLAAIARVGTVLGVRPMGFYGGITLALTILADVNVTTATVGSVTAEVLYISAADIEEE